MAVFKCKMCGGALEVEDKQTIISCDYCGTNQTIPAVDDEIITNLFNRANNLRLKCEFDKAQEIYEKIINDGIIDSEAYWGLILCKYGIEYVEDPKTHNRMPTCHRTQVESVLVDLDYQAAIEHCDASQRIIYEREAKAIDEIQKRILSVVHSEEPYDVFICYKETDSSGSRTKDSVIANDIYYQLTQAGYKVFYAAITLEDKLGQEYEPYIFAALNSAKVMLVIGTKPEYFNAVWVKNEWSRYLKIMAKDKSRLLIPCYRDMDAYDLPDEFAHFQAQDMGKIGFIEDLIRGIKKVVKKVVATDEGKEKVVEKSHLSVTPLLKRVFIFLEDGDWGSADSYCEKVLDLDPENGEAYLGKLLCSLKLKSKEELKNFNKPFTDHPLYGKMVKYGDEKLKEFLQDVLNTIHNNILEEKLIKAKKLFAKAKTITDYKQAAEAMNEIIDYKDAQAFHAECLQKIDEIRKTKSFNEVISLLNSTINQNEFEKGIARLEELGDFKNASGLKLQYQEFWRKRHEIAIESVKKLKLFQEEIAHKKQKIQEIENNKTILKKKIADINEKIRNIEVQEQKLTAFNKKIEELTDQLQKCSANLSALGFFAMSKKREINEQITQIQKELKKYTADKNITYSFLTTSPKKTELINGMEESKRKIEKYAEEKIVFEEENKKLAIQKQEIVEILKSRQILSVICETEYILDISAEQILVKIIREDGELKSLVKNSEYFCTLSNADREAFNIKSAKLSLDYEARYYQAIQALENAKSIDDILWAKDEFSLILKYKDAAKFYAKCEEALAKIKL